jgi:hypothetical protein
MFAVNTQVVIVWCGVSDQTLAPSINGGEEQTPLSTDRDFLNLPHPPQSTHAPTCLKTLHKPSLLKGNALN